MSIYCSKCGSPIPEGVKFCGNCGAEVASDTNQNENAFNYESNNVYLPVGYSDRVNDPEVLAAAAKNRKIAKLVSIVIILIPFIAFTIYGFVSDKLELKQAMIYGAIVSVIFFLFSIRTFIKDRAKNSYDAVVIDKKTRTRHRQNRSNSDLMESYTEYITIAETTDGKKKKIVEREGGMVIAYNYLQVGDRFMYHPQFNFRFEHYDKSKAPYIGCVSCNTHNPVTADRCEKCGIPLLK